MSIVRILFFIFGTISLALGILGIFLPLLPTTPFLLLTAFLYFKSSPKAYRWLMEQKHLGPYIKNYREHKIIPKKAKIISLTLLWVSILNCVFFVLEEVWICVLLIAISIGITIHILSFKSETHE